MLDDAIDRLRHDRRCLVKKRDGNDTGRDRHDEIHEKREEEKLRLAEVVYIHEKSIHHT
jgi:hypothetical protein